MIKYVELYINLCFRTKIPLKDPQAVAALKKERVKDVILLTIRSHLSSRHLLCVKDGDSS